MRKELRERTEKLFVALSDEVTKNPRAINDIQALLRDLGKEFRVVCHNSYSDGVAARKAEREATRTAKAEAIEAARTAKEEAKAKLSAALAMKVNNRIARKRTKAVETAPVAEDLVADIEPANEEAPLPDLV